MAKSKSIPQKKINPEQSEVTKIDCILKPASLIKRPTGGIRRPHRFRPGTVALREIRRYQRTTKLQLPSNLIRRAVRSGVKSINEDFRIEQPAVDALQCAAEDYITTLMRIGFELAVDNGRETILPEDFKAAVEIDCKFRQDKREQFKTERRQVETDYRKNLPEIEKEIDSWEWETD